MKNKRDMSLLVLAACTVTLPLTAGRAMAEDPYVVEWTYQTSTPFFNQGFNVATDSAGNSFVAGRTTGLLGSTYSGSNDAFLMKVDTAGSVAWTRQFGTTSYDVAYDVVTDQAGNIYISGYTQGSIGASNAGGDDAYVRKYDSSGNVQWTHQLGTASNDYGLAIEVDTSGNVFVAGRTGGQLGASNFGGGDAYVRKLDTNGNPLWTSQIGTSSLDEGRSLAVDADGNAYLSGFTEGSLGGVNAGNRDAFLVKVNSGGTTAWTRQYGNVGENSSFSVDIDNSGNAYLNGFTAGDLAETSAGGIDTFVIKVDPSGTTLWDRQFGTSTSDYAYGVSVSQSGDIFITGHTLGDLGSPNQGGWDAFLTK